MLCCNVIMAIQWYHMMTSSNGNIFRVTGPLYGEFTGPGELPTQRPVTRSSDVFFDLRLNKGLSKQSWGWWFETLSRPLWCQCNDGWLSGHERNRNIANETTVKIKNMDLLDPSTRFAYQTLNYCLEQLLKYLRHCSEFKTRSLIRKIIIHANHILP